MERRDLPEPDAPEPDEPGLSTDDLAAARQRRGEDAWEAVADAPPTLPGEADTEVAAEDEPLLGQEEDEFRSRWQKIQGYFVDDPRDAVGAADQLVAEVMQSLATTFSDHKQGLEDQWQRGEEVPTEELRVALQRYRSFFNRLLSA